MIDINIGPNTTVNPLSRERLYRGAKDKALLLLHGYTGSPHNMTFLGEKIYQETNLTVYIPRLPGHGTCSDDFRHSKSRDWLRKVYDSYLNLQLEYNEVYVAGLSMGGLLAILTAAKFNTRKLVLIAAALYSSHQLLPLCHLLKYIKPYLPEPIPESELNGLSEAEKNYRQHYGSGRYTAPLAELHKLMLLARKKLPFVTAETLILASRADDTVPLKAARTIEEKIGSHRKQTIIFEDSPHVINDGPEREECAEQIIKFLTR